MPGVGSVGFWGWCAFAGSTDGGLSGSSAECTLTEYFLSNGVTGGALFHEQISGTAWDMEAPIVPAPFPLPPGFPPNDFFIPAGTVTLTGPTIAGIIASGPPPPGSGCTATGSTAYAFSVGGPLILPASSAIMIAPIAPHLSFANAVVFDPHQSIRLEVQDEPARLSLDGQEEHALRAGDRIEVRRADAVARLVRPESARPFLSLLRQKILKEPGTS